ncbi:MAG TPA: trypsin-like peptidase domain-containing protein [Vicinamibacterales bacterium]|nr:trypsin-like peptidase domain-containing protein [Vicinamibacterales bacterium]
MKPIAHSMVALAVITAAPSDAQSLREVFRRVNPSVVLIEARGAPPQTLAGNTAAVEDGVGSGVLISADGRVLTAAHVVQGADEITVRFTTGNPVPARVVATAPFADIALLQLAAVPAGASAAVFGNSDVLEIGDQVFTIGAPYGANHSLAVGWISARRMPATVYEDATALEVFQTDLSVYEGNSGGPLFNLQGEVVGIVTHVLAREGSATGPSFSVTGNVARKLMIEQRRTWFGVESMMIDGDLAQAFHLPEPAGLLVQSVATGSLADRLGIREGRLPAKVGAAEFMLGGDVLLEVHGVPVSSTPEFVAAFNSALNRVGRGDTVTVRVWRRGKAVVLTTTAVEP